MFGHLTPNSPNVKEQHMTQINRIPASRQGDYLCESRTPDNRVQRCITTRPQDAARLERAGATVWVGRHGGWVRKG